VIDSENMPVGTILLRYIVTLSDQELETSRVKDYALKKVAKVDASDKALNLAEVFRNTGLPILAIVDPRGKFVGSVREREIIRRLASLQENYFRADGQLS